MRRWLKPLLLSLTIISFALFHFILPSVHGLDNAIQPNTVDGYYMLRYAEIWPNYPETDYYFSYPEGQKPTHETWPAIIAVTADSFGVSDKATAAFLPPILFGLTLVVVYFIGHALFKSNLIAVIGIFVLSLMPGEFLHRTMLGATDHHSLEIFLVSLVMLFAILAVQNLKSRSFAVYSLCGLAVAVFYAFSWGGWPLIIPIFGLFLAGIYYRKWWFWLPVAVVAGLVWFFNRAIITEGISLFTPHISTTVGEMMPLFFTAGQFDFVTVVGYFSITYFLSLFGLGVLIRRYQKQLNKELVLFLAWSIVMLLLSFAARRFVYYLAVNVSLIAGFVVVYLVKLYSTNKVRMYRMVGALVITIPLMMGYLSGGMALSDNGKMPVEWQQCCAWLQEQGKVYITTTIPAGTFLYDVGTIDHDIVMTGYQMDLGNYGKYYGYNKEKPEYGVLSHWNYGYWIAQTGHMPASYTPGNWLGNDILCKADLSQDIKANRWKYIVIDEQMFTTDAYPIFYSNGVLPADAAVYKLYYYGTPVWQSDNGKVRVYETEIE